MKKIIVFVMLAFMVLPLAHNAHAQDTKSEDVTIFFNEACKDCGELVKDFYPEFFDEYGYNVELKDYVNERENRKILSKWNEDWGIPFELQSHIEAFVGEKLLLGGHIPEGVMRYVLENPNEYNKLLIFQDKMHGEETEYKVWDFESEVKTYDINEPITTFLNDNSRKDDVSKKKRGFWGMFTLVTSSAFLDGLNPCAFAVLLFFIAFLFTLKKTKASIWKMGMVYISAIFLAYLLIGVGLAQAFIISGSPHLMAYIGSYLVIALGIIQLIGVVYPKFPIKLRIPVNTKATLEKWMYKATMPSAFIGGFIVGLCTFPCSGGIYVAIIGMLSVQGAVLQGFSWMVWYNVIFVLPLVILLVLSSNKKATEKLQTWERSESKNAKIISGLFMIALGAIIIIFFT